MHYKFANALLEYKNNDSAYVESGDKAVIVVETRPNVWFPLVIKNIIDRLPGWKIYVVGSKCSVAYLNTIVRHRLNYVMLPSEHLSVKAYNKMMLSTRFWELFEEEHLLIAQPDCFIMREPMERHFQYPFIGAVCFSTHEDTFVMNGGLSLRKRSVMLKICSDILSGEESEPEDVVLTNIIRNHKLGIPTIEECNSFAIESMGDISTAVGVHGTDKNYLSSDQIFNIFASPSKSREKLVFSVDSDGNSKTELRSKDAAE